MSEKRYKRFYVSESENQLTIYDNEGLDDYYHLGKDERDVKGICNLLNKQQADLNYLAKFIGEFKVEEFKLKLRNLRMLEDKVLEQQATIRKLQDLCGESDSENAKLRKEIKLLKPVNVEQYEQIVQLQEENEKLRQQLKEKEEDERLYANEIVKLNKEAKEVLDFKSLGGDY